MRDNIELRPSGETSGVSRNMAGKIIMTSMILCFAAGSMAQNDRLRWVDLNDSVYQVTAKKLIIPGIFITYGFAQFAIDPIVDLNLNIRSKIIGRVSSQWHIDDYSQYAPAAAVYGLNLLGIKGKHNFLDRSIILGTSLAVMEVSVGGLKKLTHIRRPDESTYNSFPSGHTATAFACAEFLYQEYKDVSVWYGIAGYAIATGTGFMRMYNNRHWLTDVVAGAGFGIVSTKAAYWFFPKIKKFIFKDIQFKFSLIPPTQTPYGPIR